MSDFDFDGMFSSVKQQSSNALADAKSFGTAARAKTDAATSVFSTTAKDTLMAVDGYGKSAKDVLTQTQSLITTKIKSAKDWLFNSEIGGLGSLSDALKAAADAKKDIDALQKEITSTINDSVSSIRGLTDDVMRPAQDVLYELNKIPLDKLSTTDGWISMVAGSSVSQFNDLGNLAKNFLSKAENIGDQYKSKYAQLASAVGILDNASTLGYISIIDSVMDEYGTEPATKETLVAKFPYAITTGDVGLMKSIVEHLGADYILVKYPNAIQRIITGFVLQIGVTSTEYSEILTKLKEVMALINPTWYKAPYSNGDNNVGVFANASTGCQALFKHDPTLAYMLCVGLRMNNNTSALDTAKSMYPYMIVRSS